MYVKCISDAKINETTYINTPHFSLLPKQETRLWALAQTRNPPQVHACRATNVHVKSSSHVVKERTTPKFITDVLAVPLSVTKIEARNTVAICTRKGVAPGAG